MSTHHDLRAVSSPPRPLSGIHVVSVATNLPGPLAAARLQQMGATVTKIEPPSGDLLQRFAPGWYAELAAGQEITRLDLAADDGRAELERHLTSAHVVITAMRPSALRRLGIAEAAARHGAVIVEIVGFDGDREEEPGHDLTYQAAHGTLSPGEMPRVPVVDMLGAERAVSAALAGVRQRDLGEPSPHWRVVLDDAARDAGAAVRHGLMGPGGPLGGAVSTYALYPSSDGYVAVAALEPHFAQRLADAVAPDESGLRTLFRAMSSDHWEALGRECDIPIVAVATPEFVSTDE